MSSHRGACLLTLLLLSPIAPAQLLVDFNSTSMDGGPHPEAGYFSFDAAHENSAQIAAQRDFAAFGTSVSLTVDFPDSSDNRVEQMIDRPSGNDSNWQGDRINLLTDWIGVDARTVNGGNGDYDGVTGTPTRITFTLGDLPPAAYHWRSFHHDTEHMNGLFRVEYSTNGGGSFVFVNGPEAGGAFRQTDSSPGGSPASAQTYDGVADPDPANLPSTVDFDFVAIAGQDVVVRFTPLADPAGLHVQFAVINGFEITTAASPDSPTDISLSSNSVSRNASIGSLVGVLSTTDPNPGDQHSYELVAGPGDTHNGEFTLAGDRLLTERDLTVRPAGSFLSIRVRSTDLDGNSVDKAFAIEIVNDGDGDGLDDDWELLYFPDLDAATGTGNNDADQLDNLQEQTRGTNPTLADTDGDGLDDDLENASGLFNGPGDPGSDPTVADTDGDGLDDGEEVSASNGHITNPNLADSDGDSFNDAIEIREGSDPNNPASFPVVVLPLVLNEILTRNQVGITDGFGTREDWIEIYNPNPTAVDLDPYFLTDDPLQPMKWSFPDITIPANGYLLVFASGINLVDPDGHPHTSFQLDSDGEFLAIVGPDGATLDDAFQPEYPEQFTDISYGRQSTNGALRFFSDPTPGTANGTGYPGVVKDTNFSVDRGFYNDPIEVAITTGTPDAVIRYTTDGSSPSPTHGRIYDSPIPVATTLTLRAIAYKSGWLPTNVDTQTYIFVERVAQQPRNPRGWPTDWNYSSDAGSVVPADYEMDRRVVNNTLPGYSVPEALLDIPSVSIAMEPSDFLNSSTEPDTGMYSNPLSRFERPCSIEYIRPDGVSGFQYDAKIEVHGNASRRPARMQKHSLRVTFTTEFGGPGTLEYPLFPESPVDRFNKLVLRACFTDSWGLVSWGSTRYRPNDSQYIRDVWMKESLRAMGQPSSHGNFVHLYVNGLYFGLHNLTERLEDDFWAEHLGGEPEHWEVNKDLSGGGPRWNRLMSILNGNIASPAVYTSAQAYLDMENFADYMLLHFYADSEDWPHHNGYAAANGVSGDGRFRFWCWDQEIVLDKYSWNRYGDGRGAGAPFQRLRQNEEFRILFADRVQKHLFNGGALSEQASVDRYLGLANRIDKAIVAESARWGDTQATTPYGLTPGSSTNPDADYYPPTINNPIYFTREQHWVTERDNVVNNYIPTLHDQNDSRSIIRELRANNLFPDVDAPVLSRFGGVVPNGFELSLSGNAGTIYYTTDGSDPREVGGSVNQNAGMFPAAQPVPVVLTRTGTVKARILQGREWSALTQADFIVGTPASPSNLVVSEIMYNPIGASEEAEYVELMNISAAEPIDLTNVSFEGITYTFPAGLVLAPGERLVVVKNQAAFAATYPVEGVTIAPGEFTGSLSNSGEELAVLDQSGTDLRRFHYRDELPWPTSPDGLGFSLTLVAPASNPDHGLPENWRASVRQGGSPGRSDAETFSGDPFADADRDGRNAFFEYAFGTSDQDPTDRGVLAMGSATVDDGAGPQAYLQITFTRNLAADDAVFSPESSVDLLNWESMNLVPDAVVNHGNGRATFTYRSTTPLGSIPREFLRIRVTQR